MNLFSLVMMSSWFVSDAFSTAASLRKGKGTFYTCFAKNTLLPFCGGFRASTPASCSHFAEMDCKEGGFHDKQNRAKFLIYSNLHRQALTSMLIIATYMQNINNSLLKIDCVTA